MRASSRRRARAPTARRFFALFSSLAVAARAAPDRVGCDRKVSGVDIMTKSRIMNRTPSVGSFVTASAPTYGPNDSITITLTGLASAAFAHASAGTATTISGFTAKSCGGTAQQYANSGASGTKTFTWTAPADLTSVLSVDISAGYAAGQGAVTRQTITLTRAATACGANERVSNNACVACPAGSTRTAGDPVYGGDTTCTATLCATNERVSNNACVACAGSATNAAGDDATQSDTTCDGAACASNQHVSSGSCTACPAGTTRAAGDDPSGGIDTACAATACGANERVSNNACVACAAYTTNAAGDLANGGDTACDAASAAPAGPKFIVFALFTALACACARVA